MKLADLVRQAGVVGAGGGGFPTHVKLSAQADTVIVNGAECEPLLHKDAVLMERAADRVVAGLRLAMEAVGAQTGVIGIKAKKHGAIEAIEAASKGTSIRVHLLGDYYPAGDEYDLVYSVTGRLIPPGGIPIQVGVVAVNVETAVNVAAAAEGRPVTHKILTIAGAVREPVTLSVPLGAPIRAAIEAAGGLATGDPVLCIGGLMMGSVTDDLETPIVKTTTGVVVLPRDHPVIQRKLQPDARQAQIGKSACDQCRFCTELCPRYLLGYAVEPHQVMRSLAFTAAGEDYWNLYAALCCSCGLCTLYACPEQLFPKEACDASKAALRQRNLKWTGSTEVRVHPLRDGRRVPIRLLTQRLGVIDYDQPAPYRDAEIGLARVVLPLKQGAGAPCQPLVKAGDRVGSGQPLGAIPDKALGAAIHAPFAGRVAALTDRVVLERIS